MGNEISQFSESIQKQIRKFLNEDNQARLSRRSAQLQKQQDVVPGKADNQSEVSEDHAGYDTAIPHAVNLSVYCADKRRRDLDGILATCLDTMVQAGALADDNRFCVPKISIESFDCEKGQDRVEIEIIEML